jgi:hypothetical protein
MSDVNDPEPEGEFESAEEPAKEITHPPEIDGEEWVDA